MNQTASPAALVADEPLIVPVVPFIERSMNEPKQFGPSPLQDVRWLNEIEEMLLNYAHSCFGVPAAVFQGETGATYSDRAIALQQWLGTSPH